MKWFQQSNLLNEPERLYATIIKLNKLTKQFLIFIKFKFLVSIRKLWKFSISHSNIFNFLIGVLKRRKFKSLSSIFHHWFSTLSCIKVSQLHSVYFDFLVVTFACENFPFFPRHSFQSCAKESSSFFRLEEIIIKIIIKYSLPFDFEHHQLQRRIFFSRKYLSYLKKAIITKHD